MAKKTKVLDFGYKKAIDDLAALTKGKEIAIGITGDKAIENVDGDFRMVDIAAVHEFGSLNKRIPERSFIRAGIDSNREKIATIVARVAMEVSQGRIKSEKALDRIGVSVSSMIKSFIKRGIPPPLKDATKKEKMKIGGTAKDTPLIRTGRLLNSITHVVRESGETKGDARNI